MVSGPGRDPGGGAVKAILVALEGAKGGAPIDRAASSDCRPED